MNTIEKIISKINELPRYSVETRNDQRDVFQTDYGTLISRNAVTYIIAYTEGIPDPSYEAAEEAEWQRVSKLAQAGLAAPMSLEFKKWFRAGWNARNP